MIRVTLSLPSGRQKELSFHATESVASLLMLAQDCFACRLQLAKPNGMLLTNLSESLEKVGLEAGGDISCCVLPVALAANQNSCLSIGHAVHACVVFQEMDMPPQNLKHVIAVQVSSKAVAAILIDETVVTWGRADAGGDSAAVQDRLRNVVCIQSTECAFAAVRRDGTVIAWGHEEGGGYLSDDVQEQLFNVQCIQAFAAIRADGRVVAWGDMDAGGDARAVETSLVDVRAIQSNFYAFAALAGGVPGDVLVWGDPDSGGRLNMERLIGVIAIQGNQEAFASVLEDGRVVTWGSPDAGGDSSLVQTQLYDVLCVQASSRAFAALRQDGCVVAWGDPCFGGAAVQVQNQLLCAVAIQSTSWAFAALLADGSVVSWGEGEDEIPWTATKKDLTSATCIAATGGDR